MATRCNGVTLPFWLYFEDRNRNRYEVFELWNSEKNMIKGQFPILKENAKIGLQFYAEGEYFDPEAEFKIETNLYNDQDEQELFVKPMSDQVDDIKWIYEIGREQDFPWRMGFYLFQVTYKGEKFFGGINVLPHHLDLSQVEQLHQYLNNQVEEIIYDFVYSNNSFSDNENKFTNQWYYNYVRHLSEHFEDFMFTMNAIKKKPEDKIVSTYKPDIQHGHIDQKSIRWAQTSKGIGMSAIHGNQIQLLKKKVNDINSKENQWLKNILLLWKRDIFEVYEHIKKDDTDMLIQLKYKQELLGEYELEKQVLFSKKDLGGNTKKDIKSRIFMTRKDIETLSKRRTILFQWLDLLNRMENKLVFFLNHSFLRNVSRGYKKPILKNFRYFHIDSLYEEMMRIKDNDAEEKHVKAILKPTWLLYEYFCLFKVVDLFQHLGYTIKQGIDESLLKQFFEDSIPGSTQFILENVDREIHIWYDHYHAHTLNEAKRRGESFYIHDPKKKPDIKVDAFEKKENELWHRGSLILDAKFSKMKHIYNDEYVNETTEQLTGYYSFFYIGKSEKKGTSVNKVICLYAGDDANNVEEERHPITFIKFHPFFNQSGTQLVGETELLKHFKNM